MNRLAVTCVVAMGCNATPDAVPDARPDSPHVVVVPPDADLRHCRALLAQEQGCSTDPLPDLAGKWLINGGQQEITFGADSTQANCLYATTTHVSLSGYWTLGTTYTTHSASDGAFTAYGHICVTSTGELRLTGHRQVSTPGGHEPIEWVDMIFGTLTRPQ